MAVLVRPLPIKPFYFLFSAGKSRLRLNVNEVIIFNLGCRQVEEELREVPRKKSCVLLLSTFLVADVNCRRMYMRLMQKRTFSALLDACSLLHEGRAWQSKGSNYSGS